MTAALDAIRTRHAIHPRQHGDLDIFSHGFDYCDQDNQEWPCDAAQLLAALDRAEAVVGDLYSIAVSEHGHDETHSADWPACLPAHIAMNRFRAYEDADKEGVQP